MGSLFRLLGLCFWVCFFSYNSISVDPQSQEETKIIEGTLFISGKEAIGTIDDDFVCATLDWWPPEKCDYGTCSWEHSSLFNLDLNNKLLLNAIKAFSPLKLRLGGSLQDKLLYESEGDPRPCLPFKKDRSQMFGFTQGCLPMARWDELNNFFDKAGALVIFGLNALTGKVIKRDGSTVGPWRPTNAESFIRYTVNMGYRIHGWELGNELSGNGVGARIAADQYSIDAKCLKSTVDDIYRSFEVKPLVIAPGGFFDAKWFEELLDKTNESVDIVTHHIYNLGPGVDPHLISKILDPSYLDREARTFSSLRRILKSTATSAVAWVGKAGGAYNSGRNHISNAFVYSFWYLDQLGMSSVYDTKTYCRQTLIGGNYGLLNTTNFTPNPDYFSALLWHQLMGRNVLSASFSGTRKIRAYVHCAKQSQGITLLLINLHSNTIIHVHVHVTGEASAFNSTWSLRRNRRYLRSRFIRMPQDYKINGYNREEYHLTAKDRNLHSQIMLLNGNILTVNPSGDIPPLEPVYVDSLEPIIVSPYSIVFVHFPNINIPACK